MNPTDVDTELEAWWDVQAHTARQRELADQHECPGDMPPCPDCQARQEAEDEREYGTC